jgi:hypothetical protein
MAFVRRTIRGYNRSFVLGLAGWGDADMINFFTEEGQRIDPPALARKEHGPPVGSNSRRARILPAFIRYDLTADEFPHQSFPCPQTLHQPGDFGDDWSTRSIATCPPIGAGPSSITQSIA